jgi:hypothetical protein
MTFASTAKDVAAAVASRPWRPLSTAEGRLLQMVADLKMRGSEAKVPEQELLFQTLVDLRGWLWWIAFRLRRAHFRGDV